MKFKLCILYFMSFIFCVPGFFVAAQQVNKPVAQAAVTAQQASQASTQATKSAAPTTQKSPDKEAIFEDESAPADDAAEKEGAEESTETEAPAEKAEPEQEPTEEEAPAEEETPTEEEAPTEEEHEEEEAEKPKGFVSKWEDIGFDFDSLEVAPLPADVEKKVKGEPNIPEVAELDIDFEGIDAAELSYVSIPKAAKKPEGLLLQLPIVGDVALEPLMINGEHGYQFKSVAGGRTINAGILVIETYTLTLVGQEMSFVGEGTLLGKSGKLYLRQITPAGLIPVTPSPLKSINMMNAGDTKAQETTKGEIDRMIISFIYNDTERPKITVQNIGELTLESTNIVFQKDKPVLVIGTAHIFGVQAEIGLALTKMRVNAFINLQGRVRAECKDPALKDTPACQDLQFEDIIPQIAQINKSLGKSRLKDVILKINNLIVLKLQQKLTKESTYGDQLRGTLTATLNLLGTDLAANPELIKKEVSAKRVQKHGQKTEQDPLEAHIDIQFGKYDYTGTITAEMLYIKNVGKIESPEITTAIDRSGGSLAASIIITGSLIIPLQDSEPLRISPVTIELSNDGLIIEGTIPEFTYKKLQLTNLSLRFDTPSSQLVLSSTKNFGDFDLVINLELVKPESITDKESKGSIDFKAKLTTTTVCAQNEYTCIQQSIATCKTTEQQKKDLLKIKENQLKVKEAQAVKLATEGKDNEAEAAWKEWDTLAEEVFKEKTNIAECIPQAREICRRDRATCDSRQALARKQATSRVEVEQVRAELAKEKGDKKAEEKVAIEEVSFYPFRFITEAPAEIRAIKLANIDVGLEFKRDSVGTASGTLYFSGTVYAFGVEVPGKLRFIYEGKNTGGIVLTINFDHRVTLAQIFPFALSGSPYNTIYIENPQVVVSTVPSKIEKFGEIEKGIHISGTVPLSGGLADVGKLLGKEGKSFALTGTVDFTSIEKSSIEIKIIKDIGGLTVQEKCQKEELDCIKEQEKACESVAQTEQQKCKDTGKLACSKDRMACEKGVDDILRLKDVSVVIGFTPTFSVKVGLTLRPPGQKDRPIDFYGSVNFGIKDATIAANMKGTWQDAFTLPGWEIADLAIEVGQAYGSPAPSKFGGAGHIKIVGKSLAKAVESWGQQAASLSVVKDVQKELASKPAFQGKSAQEAEKIYQATLNGLNKTVSSIDLTLDAALAADAGLTDLGFEFKTSKVITWLDLLLVFCTSFFDSVKKNELVEKLKFINTLLIKVSDLSGSYAARTFTIGGPGGKMIPRGMSFACTVDLWGKKGRCKMNLRDDGLEGFATFEKIDTPYFKLTGAGEDKILGTVDDAPIMRVALNLLNQEFYIDGQVELIVPQLGSMTSTTRINIGFDELRFLMQGNVFNLFVADLEANIGSDPKKIYIKGRLQHNSLTQLEKLLKDAAKSLNEQARKGIGQARTEVNRTLNTKDIIVSNRKALEKAKQDVQRALADVAQVKTRLDAAVHACGR